MRKIDPELLTMTMWCPPQDRQRTVEELNKELRQCKLQHFIQQSGGVPPDQNTNIYLINAGIVEQEVPGLCKPRF